MVTAIDKFNYSIWFVLDKIKDYKITKGDIISYYLDLDVTRIKPISVRDERRALNFLKDNKVIGEIEELETLQLENLRGKSNRNFIIHHFRIANSFSEYYKTFTLKSLSSTKDGDYIKTTKRQVLEFIKTARLANKQSRLLKLLSNMKSVSTDELESKIHTKNLTALVRDTRKRIKKSVFTIELERSHSISRNNAYKLTINSV